MESADIQQTKIYILSNWEKDIWTRIYGKVVKNASFIYTFSREEAQLQKYPNSITGIAATTLRMPIPKKPTSPRASSNKTQSIEMPQIKRVSSHVSNPARVALEVPNTEEDES